MVHVSNRSLAYIMVAAMFITVLSTTATLTRLDVLQADRVLTGFATNPNATATFNISGATSIVFRQAAVDWGVGYVNNSPTCNLTTVGIPGHRAGCGNFSDPQPAPFTLENDGNQNVNLTVSLDDTPENYISLGAVVYLNATENATNTGTGCTLNLQSSLVSVNTTEVNLCETFVYPDANDTLDIGMKVEIPSATAPGLKTISFTATATAVS